MPIKNPALYAVVPPARRSVSPAPKRKAPVEIRSEQRAEKNIKHAIERANAVFDRLEARTAAYTKQIAALQKRKACAAARLERLEDGVLKRMTDAGLTLVDGWKISFKAHTCPTSVDITDEKLVPKTYMREKIVESPDKTLINRTLSLGFLVTDACQLPPEFQLRDGAPNELAIKAAIAEDSAIPGVEPIPSIPGARLVQRITLQRK
jgi:hypothetical protein